MTLPPQILHTAHYKHEAWSVSKYVAHHRRPMTRKNCCLQLVVLPRDQDSSILTIAS